MGKEIETGITTKTQPTPSGTVPGQNPDHQIAQLGQPVREVKQVVLSRGSNETRRAGRMIAGAVLMLAGAILCESVMNWNAIIIVGRSLLDDKGAVAFNRAAFDFDLFFILGGVVGVLGICLAWLGRSEATRAEQLVAGAVLILTGSSLLKAESASGALYQLIHIRQVPPIGGVVIVAAICCFLWGLWVLIGGFWRERDKHSSEQPQATWGDSHDDR